MTIVHVSTPVSWRGGEQQIYYLIEEQIKAGIQPVLVCAQGGILEERAQKAGWTVYSYPKKSSLDFAFARHLAKKARELKADFLHAHDSHAHTFTVLAHLIFGCKTPIILHRRVDFPVSKSFFSRFKYNFSAIKHIICVSDKVKEVLLPAIKKPEKVKVVYSGIDASRFQQSEKKSLHTFLGLEKDVILVGHVGALEQQKDYFTFIRAARNSIDSGIEKIAFVALGEGSQRKELEHYAEELGVKGYLHFPGFIPDLANYLHDLDIFLFTSETEGLGTSVIDAMCCALPIVATKAGGVPELITHEKEGLLAEVRDDKTLAQLVIRYIHSPELAKKTAQAAAEKAQFFTKEKMGEGVMKVVGLLDYGA